MSGNGFPASDASREAEVAERAGARRGGERQLVDVLGACSGISSPRSRREKSPEVTEGGGSRRGRRAPARRRSRATPRARRLGRHSREAPPLALSSCRIPWG